MPAAQLVILNLLAVVSVSPIAFLMFRPVEGPIATGAWVIAVLSAIGNVAVITFHYLTPPHPKFLVLRRRRFWIWIHIRSGTAEFLLGIGALWLTNDWRISVAMALAALLGHVPSSMAQAPIVSGAKAIMLPAYYACIFAHAGAATMLLFNPGSELWAMNTFLLFNIYVWVRIYFFVFDKLQLFRESPYTVGILAAGITAGVPALGPLWPLAAAIYIGVFSGGYKLLFAREQGDYMGFTRERARESAINREVHDLFSAQQGPEETRRQARDLFDAIDTDRDGYLDEEDVRALLASWSLPGHIVQQLLSSQLDERGRIDFEGFMDRIWTIGTVRARGSQAIGAKAAVSERDKAQFVFDHLDLDHDGAVRPFEMELLFLEWGVSQSEAAEVFRLYDTDGDGVIEFADFYERMRPVWRFAYYSCLQAEKAAVLPGRDARATVRQDQLRTAEMRRVLKEDMVAGVPWLSDASPKLVGDLAASLVSDRFAAGETLFEMGDTGDTFYVIGSGMFEVLKNGERLAELGPGSCFGEGALLSDDPREATVRATTESTVHTLSRSSFEFLTREYPEVGQHLKTIHRNRVLENLRRAFDRDSDGPLGVLSRTAPELVAELLASLEKKRIPAGTTLMRQGETDDGSCLLISRGNVQVVIDGIAVGELGDGSCVGEGGLLGDLVRSATVKTTVDTVAYRISRESFDAILSEDAGVEKGLRELNATRQEDNRLLRIKQDLFGASAFLGGVSAELSGELAKTISERRVQPNEVLQDEGSPADSCFLVGSGLLRISQGRKVLAEVGAGSCIGKHAVHESSQPAATVLALRPSVVYALSRSDYSALSVRYPELAQRFEE